MRPCALISLLVLPLLAAGQGNQVSSVLSRAEDAVSSAVSSVSDKVTSTPTSGTGSGAGGVASPPTGGGAGALRVGAGMVMGAGIVGIMAVV